MSTFIENFVPNAVERSKDRVAATFSQETSLVGQRRDIVKSISTVQINAATDLADDLATAEEAGRRIIAAQAQISTVESAIAIVRLRRLESITKSRLAESMELRARAVDLRNQAAAIVRKCEGPLAKLAELQGVPYDVRVLSLMPNTTSFGAGDYRPRSVQLEFEALDLIEKADRLDRSQVKSAGTATGNREQLLENPAFRDPNQLTPALYEIEAWLEKVEAQISKKNADQFPREYRLVWVYGQIDPGASSVEVRDSNYNREGALTFRAAA